MPRRAESRYRYESVQRPDPTRRRGCRRRFVFFHSPSYLSRRAEVSSTLRFPTLLFHTRFFLPPRPLVLAFDPGEDRVAPLTRVYYTRGEVRRGEARRGEYLGGYLEVELEGGEGGGVLVLVGCSGGLMAWQ